MKKTDDESREEFDRKFKKALDPEMNKALLKSIEKLETPKVGPWVLVKWGTIFIVWMVLLFHLTYSAMNCGG